MKKAHTLETEYGVPAIGCGVAMFEGGGFELCMKMMAKDLGTPTERFAWIPGPMGGRVYDELYAEVDGLDPITGVPYMQEVLDAWTKPLTAADMAANIPDYTEVTWPDTMTGTEAELKAEFERQHWTDYLPITLPTEERVEAMLRNTSVDPDTVTRRGAASQRNAWTGTVRQAAINAVMCDLPGECFPLLLALIKNTWCRSSSTSAVGKCAVVNGPIRHQLNIPMKCGCMSNIYNKSGMLLSRCWGLTTNNIMGGAKIDDNYQGNLGNPANDMPVVFGELEEQLPPGWNPYHVQKGFNASDSTVSTCSMRDLACGMTLNEDWDWYVPFVMRLCGSGFNKSGCTIFMDPNPLRGLLREGFDTKEKFSEWIMNNVGVTKYHYFNNQGVINYQIQSAIDRTDDTLAHYYYDLADDDMVYPFRNVTIVLAGGAKNIRWHATTAGSLGTPTLISDWE